MEFCITHFALSSSVGLNPTHDNMDFMLIVWLNINLVVKMNIRPRFVDIFPFVFSEIGSTVLSFIQCLVYYLVWAVKTEDGSYEFNNGNLKLQLGFSHYRSRPKGVRSRGLKCMGMFISTKFSQDIFSIIW